MAISENVTNENNENKEGVVVMEKNLNKMVATEDFNPNDYLRRYEDGTPYLPFKAQLAWFRRDYPNGKTVVYRPLWSEEKEPQTYVATARVYADAKDDVDSFLAEASAKRGPGLVVHDTDVEIDPYNAVQVAALSLALKLAGYWVSLTDDDKTPVDTPEETKAEAPAPAPEPVSEPVKRRRKKKGENAAETSEEVKKTEAENQTADEKEEAPAKETETVLTEEVEASSDNAPADEEKPVEAEAEATAEAEEIPAEEPAPVKEAENSDKNAEEYPEVESVEEKPATVEKPVEEAAPVEENVAAAEEAKAEEVPAQDETSAQEEAPAAVEEEPASVEETTVAETKEEVPAEKPQVTIDEAELAELRALPFANGYYNGNIGDLEAKRIEGDALCKNLFDWLLFSVLAKKKNMALHVAATRIAEALHPEWLIKDNK